MRLHLRVGVLEVPTKHGFTWRHNVAFAAVAEHDVVAMLELHQLVVAQPDRAPAARRAPQRRVAHDQEPEVVGLVADAIIIAVEVLVHLLADRLAVKLRLPPAAHQKRPPPHFDGADASRLHRQIVDPTAMELQDDRRRLCGALAVSRLGV